MFLHSGPITGFRFFKDSQSLILKAGCVCWNTFKELQSPFEKLDTVREGTEWWSGPTNRHKQNPKKNIYLNKKIAGHHEQKKHLQRQGNSSSESINEMTTVEWHKTKAISKHNIISILTSERLESKKWERRGLENKTQTCINNPTERWNLDSP